MSTSFTIPAGGDHLDYRPMFPRLSARLLACGVVFVMVASTACKGGAVGPSAKPTRSPYVDKPRVKVALLAATSGGSRVSALHAMQGARLAFDEANARGDLPVDILAESRDTQEDPAVTEDLLGKIVADPSFVAVIGWSSTPESAEITESLAAADMPYLNLSPAGVVVDGRSHPQLRMVGTDLDQASALASVMKRNLEAEAVCVAASGSAREEALRSDVAADLRSRGVQVASLAPVLAEQDDYGELVSQIKESGCEAVFWSGGGTEAGVIRVQMTEAGLASVTLAGVDSVRSEAFLDTAGSDGDGTLASCPCRDVTVSADLADQQFVQGYQARYGTPPAAFAAEGFDAASRIIEAVGEGNTDHASVATFVQAKQAFEGLAGSYRFDADGELSIGWIEFSEDRRGTWTVGVPKAPQEEKST